MLTHHHARFGLHHVLLAILQLQQATMRSYHPILAHHALPFQAENLFQV